jgi:hypothetical protein
MIPHMSLIDILFSWQKKKNSYITIVPKKKKKFISSVIKWIKYFEVLMEWISNVLVLEKLVLIENAWSRRIKRMIKNYCIFGTIVPLLNVKPNWEKVNYLSFNSFIHPFLATICVVWYFSATCIKVKDMCGIVLVYLYLEFAVYIQWWKKLTPQRCMWDVKASMFLHHTSITNQHLPYVYLYRRSWCSWGKKWRVHIFDGK